MEFRKSNSLPDQSAAPGTKGKMFALNALRIPFSSYDSTFGYMFLICVIAICINRINTEGGQQDSQFVQVLVFTRTKTISQRNASPMIHRPPQPILL